jgi:hypothetical protein
LAGLALFCAGCGAAFAGETLAFLALAGGGDLAVGALATLPDLAGLGLLFAEARFAMVGFFAGLVVFFIGRVSDWFGSIDNRGQMNIGRQF